MTQEIFIALITVIGTSLSAFAGVIVANRLSTYRINQLEKKVEMHNNAIYRITSLEGSCENACRRLDRIEHKMDG